MKTTLLAAAVLSLGLASCAEQHLGLEVQHAEAEFATMVTSKLGFATGFTLLNYGCHCGPGSPDDTIWHDGVDDCCRVHDEGYIAAPKKFEGCNCRTQTYAFTIRNSVVTCAAEQDNACAAYCCDLDKKFVDCVAGAGPLANNLASIDRNTMCPLADCRVDEDCDAGLWCDRGTCVPYCGGRDWYIGVDGSVTEDASATCDVTSGSPW